MAAGAVADQKQERAHRGFTSGAADVTSRLRLALERENDLTVYAAAALADDPHASAATFPPWVATVRVLARHSEVQAMGVVVPVRHSELEAYTARMPAGFAVSPPGRRASYCLALTGAGREDAPEVPLGWDFCATPLGSSLLAARDSGRGSYEPLALAGRTWLAMHTPVYSGAGTHLTVAARREHFMGWLGIFVDPQVLLGDARERHPELATSLRYTGGQEPVEFTSGRPVADSQLAVADLDRGWSVRTYGPPRPGGVLAGGGPLAVLLAGVAITVLLSVLLLVLATGRARALRLVSQKTHELQHQALHDALTGLPNRALVLDRVEQALARAHRGHTPLAVMFLDLDGFKGVNDTYGHAVGDQLLRAVSARLAGTLRGADTVGRLGGDEFVVLLEGSSLVAGPESVAERIQAVLAEPFVIDGDEQLVLRTHASIGIAVGPRHAADDLLRDADVALYEAKAAGKDCYVLFAPEMQVAVQDRLELETDLRATIGTGQLFLAYQPTFDLRTEKITGVEALLRWNHPTRGLVMPDQFIPAAEESGLIIPIGRWVLVEACRQAAAWHGAGHPLAIAVNVSGRQLDGSADLVEDVRTALTGSGLPASSLTLEITETMLMRDPTRSADRLHALKALGVRVAIDDFGTGYSSLAYLKQFPVDALKIDRSFISGIAESPEGGALIHTLVQLGKTLGIETYAEGIEDHSQLRHLQAEECDSGQGYLFARPLSPEALEALIARTTWSVSSLVPRQTRGPRGVVHRS